MFCITFNSPLFCHCQGNYHGFRVSKWILSCHIPVHEIHLVLSEDMSRSARATFSCGCSLKTSSPLGNMLWGFASSKNYKPALPQHCMAQTCWNHRRCPLEMTAGAEMHPNYTRWMVTLRQDANS